MKSVDPGILPQSVCFSFTPSEAAEQLLFYPIWCGHYYCTGRYFIRRDFYPAMLLAFVRRGEFRVEYRGRKHRARAGDVLLLDCAEPHYYQAEDGLEFLYLHFAGSNSREICRRILERDGELIRGAGNVRIESLLEDMIAFYERDGVETPFESSLRIYRLLQLLMDREQSQRQTGPIGEAMRYIRSHAEKNITLEELSAAANLSPFYFSRLFRQRTGFSPMEYVINARMDRAKTLLASTTKSVAEIAWEVGYSSSGSFINLFSRRAGMSPTKFRKVYQNSSLG